MKFSSNSENLKNKPLTAGDIAHYCHVSTRAVLKWIVEGKLKAYRTPGRHTRVRKDDFLKFLEGYGMPYPDELSGETSLPKVLIIDDDKEMVSAIVRILKLEKKYVLETAYDGFAAGQKYLEFNPDVILLDIKMPGMDGFEVCKKIRQNPIKKDVKILIISGVASGEDINRLLKLGADDFLAKPFGKRELQDKIEKLIKKYAQGEKPHLVRSD